MNQSLLTQFGTPKERVEKALADLRLGKGVLVVDDEDRENEGDLIFSAQNLTTEQMAMMIRECSGIVCLCLTGEKVDELALPQMTSCNTSKNGTGFTVSIEARAGITTGVSAADRVETVRVATSPNAQPSDLCHPGHVFPLRAHEGGVLSRRGHTEGTVDLMKLAGLKPAGLLCELTNPDGSMARLPEVVDFAQKEAMLVLTIEDIATYRLENK
ncbi:MAG: 3,4-dihydroxy-2-butanone-4-phosphate synthase [Desulfotalea sp.]